MDADQPALAGTAAGGAQRFDDIGFGHWFTFL
jgi:hypothetical protein